MTKKRAKKLLMAAGFDRNAANWVIDDMDRARTNKETVSAAIAWLDRCAQKLQKSLGVQLSPISVHEDKKRLFIDWKVVSEVSE